MGLVRLFGWGIVVYAILYLLVAALSLYSLYPSLVSRIVTVIVLTFMLLIAGISLRVTTVKDVLPYSLFWMLEVIALDAVFTVPFIGWQLYLDWNVWVGYVLVALVPLFCVLKLKQSTAQGV